LEGRKRSEENEVFSSFQTFFSMSWDLRNSPKKKKNNLFKWFLCAMLSEKFKGIRILEIEC